MADATFVIFGASGDLTSRKLIPALYKSFRKGRLGDGLRIIGFSRTDFTNEQWRESLAETTAKFAGDAFEQEVWDRFASLVEYHPGDIGKPDDFHALAERLDKLDGGDARRVYYLATAPRFYEPAVKHLGEAGLADETNGPRRLVVEKPFGRDLETAHQLNEAVQAVFKESQIYRIDHYLGKETVQNLLVLRFANTIFEPIWNRNYIDHVQITVAEEVDVGKRAGYYDNAGVVRDMVQNHLLQLLMITAMEAPVRYEADAVRNEKVKVLHAVRRMDAAEVRESTFRGQYRGYAASEGVASTTRTATFAALRLWIDNWRWQGVPFYLRSGKAMSCRTTQIVIQFREPPQKLFSGSPRTLCESNRLVIQVQPAEGIQMHFQTKVPDAGMSLRQTDLDFNYRREFKKVMPEAYERLLLDAIDGDASLFARSDEVEAAWKICDPILSAWQESDRPTLFMYDPGYWGPVECGEWSALEGRHWFDSCPILA
ncbi:MAG: glucose-6-phosphate dehydrogenase [Planctomycetales bacterium]|nr:glucose-6-phosphate dehydrogenase [Planctomycetales bacterium]